MDDKKIRAEISRRNLLRYLGNGAIALPFMRTLLETEVFGAASRKCMIIFYYPNGTKTERFHPDSTGRDFKLKDITAPLESVRDQILIPKNLNYALTSGSHEHGMNYFLTGTDGLQNGYSSGVSIDTVLGERLRFDGSIPVVRLGSAAGEGGSNTAIRQEYASFTSPGQKADLQDDPIKAFNSIFGSSIPVPGTENGIQPINFKKSVLDASLSELKALTARLGKIEQDKLGEHIEAVRSLERTLGGTAGEATQTSAQCTGKISRTEPFTGGNIPWHSQANYGAIVDLNIEIAIQALACGRTNVVYLQNSRSVSQRLFNDAGQPGSGFAHHSDSHDREFGGDIARYYKGQNWYMGRLAKLIGGLRDTRIGDKSLLYNSLVMALTEFGDCQAHSMSKIGMVLAGQAGGYFQTGTCVDVQGSNHNNLLVSILQAFGETDSTFGNPQFGRGPIDKIKA